MTAYEEIFEMAKSNNGIVTARDVTNANIPRRALADMVNKNLLIRAERGIYLHPESWEDEWMITQYRYSKGIYSHETALYLHGYSDRTPAAFVMTFPRGYHIQKTAATPVIEKYAVERIYNVGIIVIKSPAGNDIKVYDLEKSLCDIVRRSKDHNIEIVNHAMKQYARSKDRNMHKLMEYSKLLRVEKKIRNYMEVLL